MRALPSGWEWARFADVASVDSNLVDPADYQQLPHIAPNHIESKTGKLLPFGTVGADGVTSSKHLFRPGHILYSKIRPYLAKVVEVGFEGLCSADMYPISTDLVSAYLRYWMLTPQFTAFAAEHQGRSVLPKINQRALATLPVPVPPFAEQERIVAVMEEYLSHLDAAESSIWRAERNLAGFRNAVLRDVFDGRWDRRPFETVTDPDRLIQYGILMPGNHVPGGVPVVKVRDYPAGEIRIESLRRTTPEIAEKYKRASLAPGDVLLSIRGTYGRVALVPDELDGANVTQDSARIAPGPLLDREFLAWFLRSPEAQSYFNKVARGVAVKGVNIGDLRQLPIPVPDMTAQRDVVRRVNDASAFLDHVRDAVVVAQRRSVSLRRSLMNSAFSGQLAPQDPAEEPASALLERIREARSATQPSRKRKSS